MVPKGYTSSVKGWDIVMEFFKEFNTNNTCIFEISYSKFFPYKIVTISKIIAYLKLHASIF